MSDFAGGVIGGQEWEDLAVRVVRAISMDGPRRANSGHAGTAMALAPLAHVLFGRVMRFDPADPTWPDRDRFILSAGHASILQYAMLHLTGYDLSLSDLEAFRQLGSKTPGHPEVGVTPGVEVTTGPLGQGFANAVGMAIAERHIRETYGADLSNHRIWTIVGDGDLEEGVSHEAASLAGHLGLGRLVCVYDDNHITIDGPTEIALSDDAPARFRAYGWHVIELGEKADDLDAIEGALRAGAAEEFRPTLVVLRTHIGAPSPAFTATKEAHGVPFPGEEISHTKGIMGLPDEDFFIPEELYGAYRDATTAGREERQRWLTRLDASGDRGQRFLAQMAGDHSKALAGAGPTFEPGASVATRRAFAAILADAAPLIPGLVAGGADLTENTGTELPGALAQSSENPGGSQIYFGIREHAMASTMTGMAHHGGILPVGGTFFVFSDYMRGAIRVAAVSDAHVIYVFTHDSIGVGEDGPTHQPIEHLASLRAMPGITVLRPADAVETVAAWRVALEASGPVALILSRQNLPVLAETAEKAADGVARGGYVLAERGEGSTQVIIAATGSEVALALDAADLLAAQGVASRVVSMPCLSLFDALSADERSAVLPANIPVLSVEAASTFGWGTYADASIGIDRFGLSAPGPVAFEHLGFTPEKVAAAAASLVDTDAGPRRGRR
ncbi:MAG: transketolase [Actinomycetes bacterium]